MGWGWVEGGGRVNGRVECQGKEGYSLGMRGRGVGESGVELDG